MPWGSSGNCTWAEVSARPQNYQLNRHQLLQRSAKHYILCRIWQIKKRDTFRRLHKSKILSFSPLYNIFKIHGRSPLSPPLTRPLHPISIVNSIGPKSSSFACLFSVLLQYCGVLPLDKLKVICQKKPCDNVLSSIGHLSTICLERQSVYRQTLGMAPFRAKGFTVH